MGTFLCPVCGEYIELTMAMRHQANCKEDKHCTLGVLHTPREDGESYDWLKESVAFHHLQWGKDIPKDVLVALRKGEVALLHDADGSVHSIILMDPSGTIREKTIKDKTRL